MVIPSMILALRFANAMRGLKSWDTFERDWTDLEQLMGQLGGKSNNPDLLEEIRGVLCLTSTNLEHVTGGK
jgi:hypothetical protein